jgi:hypothetical protein
MIASSAGRVPSHTAFDVNMDLNQQFHRHVAYYAENPTEIPRRLAELDREWDIERALAAMSASFSLAGLALGFSGRRRAFLVPAIVQTFFLQHTLQGWCPPLPVLRRMGFRTPHEIDREKSALKELLRKDNSEMTGAPASRYPEADRTQDDLDDEAFAVLYEEQSIT